MNTGLLTSAFSVSVVILVPCNLRTPTPCMLTVFAVPVDAAQLYLSFHVSIPADSVSISSLNLPKAGSSCRSVSVTIFEPVHPAERTPFDAIHSVFKFLSSNVSSEATPPIIGKLTHWLFRLNSRAPRNRSMHTRSGSDNTNHALTIFQPRARSSTVDVYDKEGQVRTSNGSFESVILIISQNSPSLR